MDKGDYCTVGKKQDWKNLKILGRLGMRQKKPSATQSGIESDCSSPMLHKERRGLGK